MRRLVMPVIAWMWISALSHSAWAQPWILFLDNETSSACDAINAENVELVVFTETRELVVVTDDDVFLGDSFVDTEGLVFFDGAPFGIVTFATDGDGLRSLWWLTDTGTVVTLDPFTLLPEDSGLFPEEFLDVPCDACPFWDDPLDCEEIVFDGDEDGILDEDDFCPDTPLGEEVDLDGCACFEVDSDGDGIDDCDDLCPGTLEGEIVDLDGCSCEDLDECDCLVDGDFDGIADCDDFCPDTPVEAAVDIDGCACFELDSDEDGIDDCDDLCPGSGPGDTVDVDGCSVIVVSPPPIFISCGSFSALMLGLTFSGLCVMRGAVRRN